MAVPAGHSSHQGVTRMIEMTEQTKTRKISAMDSTLSRLTVGSSKYSGSVLYYKTAKRNPPKEILDQIPFIDQVAGLTFAIYNICADKDDSNLFWCQCILYPTQRGMGKRVYIPDYCFDWSDEMVQDEQEAKRVRKAAMRKFIKDQERKNQ